MRVPPTIRIEPSQSIAFRPASRGVFGVSISRKNIMMTNARPSKGTVSFVSACSQEKTEVRDPYG